MTSDDSQPGTDRTREDDEEEATVVIERCIADAMVHYAPLFNDRVRGDSDEGWRTIQSTKFDLFALNVRMYEVHTPYFVRSLKNEWMNEQMIFYSYYDEQDFNDTTPHTNDCSNSKQLIFLVLY